MEYGSWNTRRRGYTIPKYLGSEFSEAEETEAEASEKVLKVGQITGTSGRIGHGGKNLRHHV